MPGTMYDAMVFPSYEYREWPKHVYVTPDGKPSETPYREEGKRRVPLDFVVVNSQEEFDLLHEGQVAMVDGRIRSEDDDRAALYLAAEKVGAKIDKRWAVEKIASEIEAHKQKLAGN